MQRFALLSRRVLSADGLRAAAVLIDGGQIMGVVEPAAVPSEYSVEDLGNLVVAPGLVDAHVHINEPGRADWEGFETATRAAAAGGVTTLVDMPLNSSPVTTTVAALEAKRAAAAGKCRVDVGFYGGLVPGSADHTGSLLEAGVLGVKAFLCDSGLPEFPPSAVADLQAAMPVLAARHRPLLVHAELVRAPAPQPADPRSYAEYLASRPPAWESDAISLLIGLCRTHGAPVHIVHLANADALPMLQAARADGLPLTVETCPHYLHFAAEEIPDGDTRFKCAPPIRAARHREVLWHALQQGLIDTIGSDHSPCPPPMKQLASGDFMAAWGGISSLQLTLPIVWTGSAARGIPLATMFRWLADAPARLLRLDRKGRLAAGCDADLVVWDPEARWTVDGGQLQHRHKLTPYDGLELAGRVHRTYLRGSLVYNQGELVGEPRGELLRGAP
jgi:allantoinase